MLSHLRSCLTPGSRWRSLSLTLLLCAVVTFSFAASDRAQSAYAGVMLKPGDFVLGTGGYGVYWLDSAGGDAQPLSTNSQFDLPVRAATGPNGEVYVSDNYFSLDDFRKASSVIRVNPSDGSLTVVSSQGLGFTTGLAVGIDGTIYTTNDTQRINRINPTTGIRTTVIEGGLARDMYGLAVEADGSLLTTVSVPPHPGDGPRQILRIRAGSNEPQVVSTGGNLVKPTDLTVGPDGSIFVIDFGGNVTPPRIVKIQPISGAQSVVTAWSNVRALVVNASGSLYGLGTHSNGGYGLHLIDVQTGQITLVRPMAGLAIHTSITLVKTASEGPCSPRQPVRVNTMNLGGGRLQVTVKASGSGNTIRSVTPATVPNAVLEAPPTISGPDATFVVKRTGPGAVTVRFTVTDGCGEWPSFVGGGPNAF